MILAWNVYGKSVQPHFHINQSVTPFSLIITTHTLHDRLRVVVFHSLKKPTSIGRHIRLVAEILDHSFNSAVTDRGHVEHTTLFLTAAESQLSERQLWPGFFHYAQCDVVMWWCGIISWYHLPTSVNFQITIHLQRVSFALRVDPVFPIPFRVIWFKNMLARFSRIYSKVAKSHLIIFKEGDQI